MPQSCNYVFTLNNPLPEAAVRAGLLSLAPSKGERPPGLPSRVRWIVFQLERSPSGTPHYQGYIQFHRPQRLAAVSRILGGGAWCQPRNGNHQQAYDYATKDDTRLEGPWEAGDPSSGPGHRSDLSGVQHALDEGMTMQQVSSDFFGPFVRFHKAFYAYQMLHSVPRRTFESFDVYYGPTSTGKSHTAMERFPNAYIYPVGPGEWYPNYAGQSCIIFDDFNPKCIPITSLLRICDKYALTLPTKGGHVNCVAQHVVITHNLHPREWYRDAELASVDALMRRATLHHFTEVYVPPVTGDPSPEHE